MTDVCLMQVRVRWQAVCAPLEDMVGFSAFLDDHLCLSETNNNVWDTKTSN